MIPALNPNQTLVHLVSEINDLFSPHVVAVNDGSNEGSAPVFDFLESMGCDVLTHSCNRGKGSALKTGFKHVLSHYPNSCGIVTADADGQHAPQDIFRVAQCLNEGADGIVLGIRKFKVGTIPFKSKWGNKITSIMFWLKTGVRLRDTQTGLRAIPMRYVPMVLQAKGSRFEFETNMLLLASKMDIPFIALPIDTIYLKNNHGSHFRAVRDSARIFWDLLKFGWSSGICSL